MRPDRWPLGALLAAAPAILALPLFEGASGFEVLSRDEIEAVRRVLAELRHPKGLATYVAFMVWHAGICAMACAVAWRRIRALPIRVRGPARVMVAGIALGASAGLLAAGMLETTLARFTYVLPAELLSGSAMGSAWPTWALLLPSLAGIVTTAFVACAAHGEALVRTMPEEGAAGGVTTETGSISILVTLLHLLSLVLVSSSVGASLFFHLPVDLYAAGGVAEDDPMIGRLAMLAGEMSVFWAAIYTATLFGAVGVPLAMAGLRVDRGGGEDPVARQVRFGAAMRYLERGAVMLAPILSALAIRSLEAAGLST